MENSKFCITPIERRWVLAVHNLIQKDFALDPRPLQGFTAKSRIAIRGGKLVGAAVLDGNGFLSYLVVKESERGKGVGSQLMQSCLADLLSLTCEHDKVSFYKRFGLCDTGVAPNGMTVMQKLTM